jgi:fused signal recognition particle receptor
MAFFNRLSDGLRKTRENFVDRVSFALKAAGRIDDDLYDELEDILIGADLGPDTAIQILEQLRTRVARKKIHSSEGIIQLLKEELENLLSFAPVEPKSRPRIILVVGVNGTGKTTSVGKLAHLFSHQGQKVILGAADTFRAAAIEQLSTWAERSQVDIVRHATGADPSAVVFDTVKAAMSRNADIALLDTAGRLHNKNNLMQELEKMRRTVAKARPEGSIETWLVLDASTGQNAIRQAEEFSKVTPLTGIILTKVDGSAKGGVIFGICNQLKVPVVYIGVGEAIEDLQAFNAAHFVAALFAA